MERERPKRKMNTLCAGFEALPGTFEKDKVFASYPEEEDFMLLLL